MTLATRCVACGTVFRVTQDQLKISEGWVRCGHCQEVFNGLETLFDLEKEAPPEPEQAGQPPAPMEPADAFDAPAPAPWSAPEPAAARTAPASDSDPHTDFEPQSAFRADLEPGFKAEPGWRNDKDAEAEVERPADLRGNPVPPRADAAPAMPATPGFLQEGETQASWRRPPAGILLAAAALLGLALALQVTVHFRDHLAARWPAARPLLTALCVPLGCELQALKKVAALTVEASGLAPEGRADTFLLTMTLRNRDTVELAMPSVDLSLTDARGTLLARRMLGPADFRRAPDGETLATTLSPGGEWQVQAALTISGQPTNGYTVELFYP
jgi:predicted Zn finger-like uncharacterized protein